MGFLNKMQPLGLLVLRIVVGIVFVAHGWQKIHGGPSHFVHMVHDLGLPGWLAYLSIAAEFFGGMLLIVGFATRFAAFAILIDMLVAITKVHLHNGLLAQGGYQFPLSLAAAAFVLMLFGAGEISVDWLIGAKGK